jgi:hypothetical protein
MTHIIIPGKTPIGKCRICRTPFFSGDSERVIARHMAACGQEHYEKTHGMRSRLDFLKSQDPEYSAYVEKAYRQGKLKPSTERH